MFHIYCIMNVFFHRSRQHQCMRKNWYYKRLYKTFMIFLTSSVAYFIKYIFSIFISKNFLQIKNNLSSQYFNNMNYFLWNASSSEMNFFLTQ